MKKTLIFDWTNGIKEEELNKVIEILNNDGVVIFPTDTVYGIGCNCFSENAIKELYEFKERDYSKPINVLTDSYNNISKVALKISDIEKELIDKYMPGALTIIFDKKANVPNILTSNLNTVGVRIPNNDIALKLLSNLDYPLATTSANISGCDAGIKFEDFYDSFNGKVDVIINGGITDLKIASTIVKVDNDEVKILRQGTVKINV